MRRFADPGWAMLGLRAFLGLVFCYAGISKVADPRFLDASSPASLAATLAAVRSASPIGGLLGPVERHATGFGVVIAFAELAVGIGLLCGLFTRAAAAGGMLLSLILWLTVSWNANPWYTSADVVYLFALSPLLLAGAPAWSVDAWLARVYERRPDVAEDRTRRVLLGGGAALLGCLVLGVASAFRGRRGGGHGPQHFAPEALVRTSAVPVGGAAAVTIASVGEPAWVLQLQPGHFTALDARCPHQGCSVRFVSASAGFICPCHQSRFRADGARIDGPAPTGLAPIPVTVVGDEVRTS
jgi:thiosulfate dehydrogenase [quinone] large subunit